MHSFRFILALTAGAFVSGFLTHGAWGHDLKDGVVERDVQMVVFPDRVEIQYTIEMSSSTRDKHIEQMATERKDSVSRPASKQSISFGPDLDEIREAWDDYRKLLEDELTESFSLAIDEQQQSLELVSSETIEKHSTKLYFVFAAKFQVASREQVLVMQDKNFESHACYHRMALKGRRGVQVKDANAPFIVSQVERVEWAKLTKQQQRDASTVRARILLSEK